MSSEFGVPGQKPAWEPKKRATVVSTVPFT